jgi:hypothetical protein
LIWIPVEKCRWGWRELILDGVSSMLMEIEPGQK